MTKKERVVLLVSPFREWFNSGILLTITIATAVLADLILMPAIMLLWLSKKEYPQKSA